MGARIWKGRESMPDGVKTAAQKGSWEEWLKHVEEIPGAAYAIKNDEGLTLLGANRAFYRLMGYSQQEMRQKYADRLSALVDAASMHSLLLRERMDEGVPIEMKQHFFRNGADAWMRTSMTLFPSVSGDVLCCVSMDVTDYENEWKRLSVFEETVRMAAGQANLDYLEYDYETGNADIRFALSLLPNSLADEDGVCHDFVRRMLEEGIVCPGYEAVLQKAFGRSNDPERKMAYEMQIKHATRGLLWVRVSVAAQKDGDWAVSLWEDVTQEKEAARNYLNETQFYQAILSEKMAYGHIDVTEDRITRVGGMWNLYNEIIDRVTYSQLIREFIYKVVHPEDRKHYLEVMQTENFIQSFENGIDQLGCEFRRIVEQNKMVWMKLSVYLFRDPLTGHIIALLTIENIHEKKKQELMLLHDSSMDQLTNVYNRRMTETMIRTHLSHASPEELCAFVVLDIDDFKQINDQSGHPAGDRVLVWLSDRLKRSFRHEDVVGRFGGDEFIVFLTNVENRESVEKRMKEFFALLQDKKQEQPVFCSAGIALCQGQSTAYELLFRQADQALYRAKTIGKGRYLFYDGEAFLEERRRAPTLRVMPRRRDVLTNKTEMDREMSLPFSMGEASASLRTMDAMDTLLGVQGDMAYLIDPDTFELLCGNQAFYDRLGMSESQCAGMKCYEAMHKRDTPCPFCSKANWSTDKFYLWRNMNTVLEQEFLIKNKLVPWQDREVLLAIAVDLSNDKSIVDSIDNSAMETHGILSGVQHMTEAKSLSEALESALETIGNFFRADSVCFWQYRSEMEKYTCPYCWQRRERNKSCGEESRSINEWLDGCSWESSIMLESQEAMLGYSYNMYLYMKEHGIRNQRWIKIKESEETLGFLAIDNSSSNLQNVSFLDSFVVFIASEVKKRSLIETTLYAGQHDDLTGLYSRKSYEEYMMEYAADQISCVGVLMANLNNLKGINSSKGFQTGNYFLKLFADMLRDVFDSDHIYRLNGDEFLVILSEITRNALEDTVHLLEQRIDENGMFSVSLGYSWDDVENDLSVLVEQATQAMKVHKKRHYDAMTDTVDMERRQMLNDLVACIEKREFEVFLQPKVELVHGTVIGAEALIRYHHKEIGYIQPAQFIDILEKNNLIRYIDLFVFEEVCRLLSQWKQKGLFLPVVSLNFSRLTLLERDILENMENIISRYDVPKKHLEIEITESVSNMGKSILYQTAQDLYEAGFAISLDDFGTKYTNLSILADLDFSILKIDKSLVGELGNQVNHRLIMKNIITMCQDLDISVLAEGIETKDQEDILQTLGCNLGQGYLYGKPMPIEEFDHRYMQTNQRT